MKKKLLLITSLLIILLSKNGFATAEIPSTEDANHITLRGESDQDNFIILNKDFSFNIPLLKLVDNRDVTSYYDVDFIFLPMNNKLLFGVTKADEIERSRIDTLDVSKAIILNRDASFNISFIKYEDVDDSIKYYNADFIYTPINNKLIFEVAKVVEIQVLNENSTDCSSRAGKVGKIENATPAETVVAIEKTLYKVDKLFEAIKNNVEKDIVICMFNDVKLTAKTIESTVVYSLRERALGKLNKARSAFKHDEMELAEEYMRETVEMFKTLKDRYIAFN